MPLYEYVCEQDGTRIELLRSMAQADDPVADPEGRGRRFVRAQSTFSAGGSAAGAAAGAAGAGSMSLGGCCPCGKSAGACGRN